MRKVEILDHFCRDYGMTVNNDKTKFFVLYGEDGDADTIRVNDLVIEHCRTLTQDHHSPMRVPCPRRLRPMQQQSYVMC